METLPKIAGEINRSLSPHIIRMALRANATSISVYLQRLHLAHDMDHPERPEILGRNDPCDHCEKADIASNITP
jgi:hypothetical protein